MAASQTAPPQLESLAELARIRPDTYLFRYQNHVAMFIVTDEGVILTDPCGQGNPRTPSMIKEAIRSVTDQPVRYLLYSHWGADHGIGGAVFRDTARFISHRNAAPKIATANDPTSPVPDETFDTTRSVELGGKKVDLYFAEVSPNDDYFFLHYPEGRLVMAVDLVQPRNLPFRDLLGHPDWIVKRLQWLHDALDYDVVVSGHAQPQMVGTKEDVQQARQYYLDLSDAIGAARSAGKADNSQEMVDSVRSGLTAKYGLWRRFDEFLHLNIEGMIRWRNKS
jgi:glyoxylase-like metal-dependent hydrolase (beta-lactamase superfamily II)